MQAVQAVYEQAKKISAGWMNRNESTDKEATKYHSSTTISLTGLIYRQFVYQEYEFETFAV